MCGRFIKIIHFDQVYMDDCAAVQYNGCLFDKNEKILNGSDSGEVPTMVRHDRGKGTGQAIAEVRPGAACQISALIASARRKDAVPAARPA
jgi:hypothetical protein